LNLIDVITLWTGDMANLEAHLKKAEKLAPKLRKMVDIRGGLRYRKIETRGSDQTPVRKLP